ncbi:UNVERIFIED_CONTAM: hypothetical protein NCL1_40348 [Trichonephila clavipes]
MSLRDERVFIKRYIQVIVFKLVFIPEAKTYANLYRAKVLGVPRSSVRYLLLTGIECKHAEPRDKKRATQQTNQSNQWGGGPPMGPGWGPGASTPGSAGPCGPAMGPGGPMPGPMTGPMGPPMNNGMMGPPAGSYQGGWGGPPPYGPQGGWAPHPEWLIFLNGGTEIKQIVKRMPFVGEYYGISSAKLILCVT